MSKMGGSPQVLMTDGEGAIQNIGLFFFQKVFHGTSFNIHTVKRSSSVPRKDGHNFQGDVRQADQARRTLDILDISYIIIFYKVVHFTTEFTQNDARNKSNEGMPYITMKMKAKQNRRYPELHIVDTIRKYRRQSYLIKGMCPNGPNKRIHKH